MTFRERAAKWLREQWKDLRWVLFGAVALAGVLAVRKVLVERRRFRRVRNDPHSIAIDNGVGDFIQVKLPDGVIFDDVTAAGVSNDEEWAIETIRDSTDRRGDPARGRESDLGL